MQATFRVAMAVVLFPMLGVAVAAEPQESTGLHQRGFGVYGYNFAAGNLVTEKGGSPVACFGYIKVKEKTRHTYFILFKADPTKHKPCGYEGVGSHGSTGADLRITISAGDTNFQYSHKVTADFQAGTIEKESVTIDGKEYDKNIPPLFLVDLTQEKIVCRVVKDAQVEFVGHDEDAKLEKLILGLKENNKEVKEFFQGKAK